MKNFHRLISEKKITGAIYGGILRGRSFNCILVGFLGKILKGLAGKIPRVIVGKNRGVISEEFWNNPRGISDTSIFFPNNFFVIS